MRGYPGTRIGQEKVFRNRHLREVHHASYAAAGWDTIEQIYLEYTLRPGRVVVRGYKASRDKKSVLRADYVLFYKTSIPLAVIEAKDKGGVVQVQDQNTERP